MSGKHKCHTIAFRPSDWQRSLIEERAALSGHLKKDFIAQSCIYSNIVVVGKKENVKRYRFRTGNAIRYERNRRTVAVWRFPFDGR